MDKTQEPKQYMVFIYGDYKDKDKVEITEVQETIF